MAKNERAAQVIQEAGGVSADVANRIAAALAGGGLLAPQPKPATKATPGVIEADPILHLRLQLGVLGYLRHGGDKEFTGTIEEVAAAVDADAREHYQDVHSAWEDNGDHRAFCPQFANGYPTTDPSDGEVASFSVTSVALLRMGEKATPVPHSSPLHVFMQAVANGDHRDVAAAVAEFRTTNSRSPKAAAPAAGPAPR